MIDVMKQTLHTHKLHIEDKIASLKELEAYPLHFFKPTTGLSEDMFLTLLEQRDPQYVLDYQRWLYPKLIEAIKSQFNVDQYTFSFQPKHFPSPIQLSHEFHIVADIHPYDRLFVYHCPKTWYSLIHERRDCLLKMVELEEEIALREMIEQNPILMGKGHMFQTTKAMLSKKKVKQTVKEEAVAFLEELSELNRRVTDITVAIEQEENKWLTQTVHLDRVAKRLHDVLHLTIVNPIHDVEAEDQTFFERDLIHKRQSYRNALYQEWQLDEARVKR